MRIALIAALGATAAIFVLANTEAQDAADPAAAAALPPAPSPPPYAWRVRADEQAPLASTPEICHVLFDGVCNLDPSIAAAAAGVSAGQEAEARARLEAEEAARRAALPPPPTILDPGGLIATLPPVGAVGGRPSAFAARPADPDAARPAAAPAQQPRDAAATGPSRPAQDRPAQDRPVQQAAQPPGGPAGAAGSGAAAGQGAAAAPLPAVVNPSGPPASRMSGPVTLTGRTGVEEVDALVEALRRAGLVDQLSPTVSPDTPGVVLVSPGGLAPRPEAGPPQARQPAAAARPAVPPAAAAAPARQAQPAAAPAPARSAQPAAPAPERTPGAPLRLGAPAAN
jgi:hypothetical protein